MAWHANDDALYDETAQELQDMLHSPPPKRTAGRWALLGLATASLALVGVGLVQSGAFAPKRSHSVLAQISMVHHQINAIVKSAVEKGDFNTKIEFAFDDYAEKDNPPSAMSITSSMQVGGEGKWPKVLATLAAQDGQAAELKSKAEEVFEALLTLAPESEVDEIKRVVTISAGQGDTVEVQVTLPPDAWDKAENKELKAAFKQHKPRFHAAIDLGRSFEGMHAVHDKSAALAFRGFQVSLGATFANSIFELLANVPGFTAGKAGALQALKMARVRNEIFYSSEEELLQVLPPFPPLKDVIDQGCAQLPGQVSAALKGIDKLMAGVSKVVLEGLPYDWEVVTDFKNFNPGHILGEHCAVTP
mmetsp:Transcript_164509/g.399927  ORF Transcript_164509/g.399927 Transcript_164509/m.399927 type:complete len:361 (-) Transcript_164509:56-1138(-)